MQDPGSRSFKIGACVGRGGFGEVYRASMRSAGGLETEVALKVLRPDPARREDTAARFRDEGRMLSRLQHPAIVKVFDWADLGDGHVALVTEFVDGTDLHLCAAEGLPERPLLEVVAAVASALDAAWSTPDPSGAPLRVVHRDVKPPNVRLGRHGQVRLLDFGIARFGSPDRESQTESDLVVGSMPYMAPERFSERSATPAADVYGLGCCLYEGLARLPFHREARLRELTALALDRPRFEEHRRTRLAELDARPEVVALLDRCLSFDPAVRPDAAEVASACEALAETASGPPLRRWCAETTLPDGPLFPATWTGRRVVEGEVQPPAPERARPNLTGDALSKTLDPTLFDDSPLELERPQPPRSTARLLPPSALSPPATTASVLAAPVPSSDLGSRVALGTVGGLGCVLLAGGGLAAVALVVVVAGLALAP